MSLLSACQWSSPITTQLQYDAADGRSAEVGDVKVLNALIVAEKQDGPGVLSLTLDNRGKNKQTVQIRVGSESTLTVDVSSGQAVRLGGPERSAQIAKVPAAPGAMMKLDITTPSSGVTSVSIPVLYPHKNGPYATMTPTTDAGAPGQPNGPKNTLPATISPSASPAPSASGSSPGH